MEQRTPSLAVFWHGMVQAAALIWRVPTWRGGDRGEASGDHVARISGPRTGRCIVHTHAVIHTHARTHTYTCIVWPALVPDPSPNNRGSVSRGGPARWTEGLRLSAAAAAAVF